MPAVPYCFASLPSDRFGRRRRLVRGSHISLHFSRPGVNFTHILRGHGFVFIEVGVTGRHKREAFGEKYELVISYLL